MPISFTGNFQFEVLKTVKRLGRDAYGMRIRDELATQLGREIHMPQVYAATARLVKLGLLTSDLDKEQSAGRRGRTRRVYTISAHGLQKLNDGVRHSTSAGPKDPSNDEESEKAATA